ncbi:MAG: hypothetical protein EXS13_11305 [Planctomycetes bacterium]|nr:hypothetical protein [Planctomycetota bacterium]
MPTAAVEDGDSGRSDKLATLAWLLVAAALRFACLGRFSLWGDEIYTLENAEQLFTARMQSGDLFFVVFYALERIVLEVAHFFGVNIADPAALQWLVRLVPAVAGTLAVGAAFVGSRGVLRRHERHVLAALIAFSPWFLWFSQTARFYSVELAFCVPATFGLLQAQREGSVRAAVRGVVWLALAMGSNPTAGLLLLGHIVAALVAALLGGRRRPRVLLPRAMLPPLALPLLVAIPLLLWPQAFADTLLYKLNAKDAGVESLAGLALGIGWNIGPVVGALGALGLSTLWRRDRPLALYVIVAVGVPTALMLTLAALGKSVDQRYLLGVVVLALLPAATFVGEMSDWLAGALRCARIAVPFAALVAWLPSVASESIDGNRHDLAGALDFVSTRLQPGDGVICDWHALARRYLPATLPDDCLLEAPPPQEDWPQYDAMWSSCKRLWVVVPADFDQMNAETRSFHRWAWSEGRLQREFWRPRLDYHQNRIRVFLIEGGSARKWHRNMLPR